MTFLLNPVPTTVSAPSTVVRAVARKSTSSKKHEIHAVTPQTPTSQTQFFSPDNIGIVKVGVKI